MIRRVPLPDPGPLELGPLERGRTIAVLFLLPSCDMRCRFCASETTFSTMEFDAAAELLEVLRARGFTSVVLGGGEPTQWPHDILGLAQRAKELGFLVQLNTNGVRTLDGFPRMPGIDRIILPVEAMDPALHDALRYVRGQSHHALVMRRIAELMEAQAEFTLSTVVTWRNVGAVADIARQLAELRARGARLHAWHLYNFLAVGRGGRPHAAELALSKEHFDRACKLAKESGLDFPVFRRPHMLRSSTVEFFWYEGRELVVGSRRLVEGCALPLATMGG